MIDLVKIELEPDFDSDDLYEILGVYRDATKQQIRDAYKKVAKLYHPDKETGNEEWFKKAKEAYEILYDADTRKAYDTKGEKPDPAKQSAMAQAVASLLNIFKIKVQQNIDDISYVNVISKCRGQILSDRSRTERSIEELYNKMYKLEKAIPKLLGDNPLLHDALADMKADLDKAVEDGKRIAKVQTLMLELLSDYDYEVDARPTHAEVRVHGFGRPLDGFTTSAW